MVNIHESKPDNPEIQTPRMYQPTSDVGRQYIFGYTESIRNTDKAMLDLFSDITIMNDNTIYPVPVVHGNYEKAMMYVFGEQFVNNVDRVEEGLIDRVTLPILSLEGTDIAFDQSRYIYHEARNYKGGPSGTGTYNQEKKPYDTIFGFSKGLPINRGYTLHVWTKYYEDIIQIIEQIYLKFSPIAYLIVKGNRWECPVKIEGSSSNISGEGDKQVRIFKYAFQLTAETHIQQPIKRDKTVLKVVEKFVIDDTKDIDSEIDTIITEAKEGDTPESIKEK